SSDQSQATALARDSGSALTAALSASSPLQRAMSDRPATTEVTKVLVAATDFSSPACRSMVKSEASARGEPAVLVMAMVAAPERRADWVMPTISGDLPDWEMAMVAARSSLRSLP